jgi:hypothetical protein
MPRTTLRPPTHRRVSWTAGDSESMVEAPTSPSPIRTLVRGPTTVMRNASAGLRSRSVDVAPPSMNRRMPATGTLRRRATPACASSCPRIEPRNSTVVRNAMANAWPPPSVSLSAAYCVNTMNAARRNHDASTEIGIPPMDPILNVLPNTQPSLDRFQRTPAVRVARGFVGAGPAAPFGGCVGPDEGDRKMTRSCHVQDRTHVR